MNRRTLLSLPAAWLCLALLATPAASADAGFDAGLKAVRDNWAIAKCRTTPKDRAAAFERLATQSAALVAKYPERAEALIWDGIVLSTYAGEKSGLGALGLAKDARDRLQAALAIDEKALDGSAHTSIGTLYHKVPGFPVGFGSDRKTREHLEKALRVNPNGIDANYFYGEFLYDEGEYAAALTHLERALAAPPRPGREIADAGRREEIRTLMATVRKEL